MAFSTYNPLAVYPADGVQKDFAAPDLFYDLEDVRAVLVVNGVETLLTQGVEYQVIVIGREPTPPYRQSGLLRFAIPPVNGASVVPFILPSFIQDQPFEGRPVSPRQHERVHDRHVQTLGMLFEFFNRGYRSPLNTPAALRFIAAGRANYVPIWDAAGNLIEGPTVAQVSQVSAFIADVVAVSTIKVSVQQVAAISGSVVTVAGIAAQTAALGNVAASVATLAPQAANIATLAPQAAALGQLGPYAAQMVQVAAIRLDVSAVAAIAANVTTAAANIAAIVDAPNQALLASRYATYAEDTDIPGTGGKRSAYHWAMKAQGFAAAVNPADLKWVSKAIGEMYRVDDSMAGADIPPTNNAAYRYVKLTAADAYNTGVLTSESVSGSAPAVIATAAISLAGSPLNGRTINLINTERRGLRAGAAGTVEADMTASHVHTGTATSGGAHTHTGSTDSQGAHTHTWTNGNTIATNGTQGVGGSGGNSTGTTASAGAHSHAVTIVSGGAHTHAVTVDATGGTETRHKNLGVTYYMRIK